MKNKRQVLLDTGEVRWWGKGAIRQQIKAGLIQESADAPGSYELTAAGAANLEKSRRLNEAHAKMEAEPFVESEGPIRTGCLVAFARIEDDGHFRRVEGVVVSDRYNEVRIHVFEVALDTGETVRVRGRNLYSKLYRHSPGEASRAAALARERDDAFWERLTSS